MTKSENYILKKIIKSHTNVGELFKEIGNGRIECYACGHRCKIGEGKEGICKVRYVENNKLHVPWGYVSSLAVDPIEKKPFYHVLPGSTTMSFGMLGCDYHCSFCQNWITSQTLRDPHAVASIENISPEDIVALAHKHNTKIITSTYNEPLITSEWAVDVFKLAKRYKLLTSYVSNGNATPEVIKFLRPWLDLFKIDLKGFNESRYRELGGVLRRVLETIKLAYENKFWVEIVTLIVTGFNDTDEELTDIAHFIASVSPDIPWHVTAFHSDYKMLDVPSTSVGTLIRAVEIGYQAGLHYVYAGNIPGAVKNYENTYCHSCKNLLVERYGFMVKNNFMKDGYCPNCNSKIPGIWTFENDAK